MRELMRAMCAAVEDQCEMRTFVRFPRAGWAVALLVIAWSGVHLLVASSVGDSVFDGGLLGPDSYMRLVRVDELWSGGGWFDQTIGRSNAPFGDELHWTRPFDLLLLAFAAPLSLALGFEDALFLVGAASSPLLHLAMLVLLVWAVVPLVGRGRAPMAAIILLVQPAVIGHTMAGQADHHSLLLLLLVLEFGLVVRVLQKPRAAIVSAAAGAVAGLGIWVSPEMTILAGTVAALLVVAWVLDPEERASALLRFGWGLGAVVLAAITVERIPTDWLTIEYDQVSVAHLGAAAAVLLVAVSLRFAEPAVTSLRGRFMVCAVSSGLAGLALLAVFGGLIAGPGAGVNPAIKPIWLDHVRELQPLFPSDLETLGLFLLYLGPALVAVPVALAAVHRHRHDRQALLPWIAVATLLTVYTVLSLLHLRFASFAGVLIAVAGADVLGQLRDRLREVPASLWRRTAWAGATIGLSVGFTIGGGVVTAASNAEPPTSIACSRSVYDTLDEVGGASDVVFANLNLGPEILYRTDLSIVAGPYHRNDRGILDLYHFFASTDLEASRELAASRDGRFVLICGIDAETKLYTAEPAARSLHDRLLADAPPDWLRLVGSGEGDDYFRLYEIEPRP